MTKNKKIKDKCRSTYLISQAKTLLAKFIY